ncbi:MFS general substrate transporter [Pleurotus eryngii]|uniref:MFS general substrate transporter n=1 Tax=Pleurotus eryngii TaxID=5323 RepID=A0A9P5ZUQ6_PLEER|nr:MFS general substrate transporter [Pleurotus eryngii]
MVAETYSLGSNVVEEKRLSPSSGEVQKASSPVSLQVDGGARAWCTLLGGVLMTTVTFGYSNSFGVYQDIYTRSHAASASNVSWIGSTQLFFLFAMGLPAGKLLDLGYLRHTNIVGSIIYVFSMFMVSLAHTDIYYQVYLSQGLGLGIGAGLLYVPAVAVQAHHWKKHRAFAMGVVVTGSSLGGIIFPIMLNQLFKSSVGFEWGVRASAFVVFGLLVVANFLISDNPSVKEDGEKPVLKNILTDIPFMLSSFGFTELDFYLQLYAILHGVDPNIAFYTLAIMNAAGLPGRIIPGILADRLGPFTIIVPTILLNVIFIFALFGISTEGGILAFAVLYGVSSGAFLTLCAPCAAVLAIHPNEVGVRFGVGFFMTGFGALIGAPIDGALLGETFPWSKPITLSGVSVLALHVLFLTRCCIF